MKKNQSIIDIAKQKLNSRQPDFKGTEYEFLHDTPSMAMLPQPISCCLISSKILISSKKKFPENSPLALRLSGERGVRLEEGEEFFTVKKIVSSEINFLIAANIYKLKAWAFWAMVVNNILFSFLLR